MRTRDAEAAARAREVALARVAARAGRANATDRIARGDRKAARSTVRQQLRREVWG